MKYGKQLYHSVPADMKELNINNLTVTVLKVF
jgi:hypothetical protein